jgi:toxin ParE1/3/4
MKLILTEAALADLRAISAYTLETWGEEQEARYIQQMWSRMELMRANPNCGRRRDDLFPGCRLVAEGRHVILFRQNRKAVEVIRVLHSAMDFRRHLPANQA